MSHTSISGIRSGFGTIVSDGTTPNESIPWRLEGSVEALLDDIKSGHHEFTKETNEDCALIMNHPELNISELPGNLACFDSYNGEVTQFLY